MQKQKYLIRELTRELFPDTPAMRDQGFRVATDEEVAAIAAGAPLPSVVHGSVPVTGDEPTLAVAAAAEPVANPETAAEPSSESVIAGIYDTIDAMTDVDELEKLGRVYGFELDRRHGLKRARAEVKKAVARALAEKGE